MTRRRPPARYRRSGAERSPAAYTLVVRGPDGEPRQERFTDVAAYRARIVTLERSSLSSLSIDEIAGLLDS
jgi:hypothetical protein